MTDVAIRYATKDDITEVAKALEAYDFESVYKIYEPINPERLVMWIASFIEHHLVIVGEVNGRVEGVLMANIEYSLWDRAECSMSLFYVRDEWRGTPMGNKLFEAWIETIKKRNYMFGTCGSSSGWGEKVEKQFENMALKHGCEVIGRSCIYFNHNTEQ